MKERCVLQHQFSDYTFPDPERFFLTGLQRQAGEAIKLLFHQYL